MIRAIALDIDGTITHDNRQLDVAAVKAVRKAEDSGISICLATGNILCFAEATSVLLGTKGPLISEDGGVVYDQSNGEEHVLGGVEEVDKGIKMLEKKFGNIQHTGSSKVRRTGRTLERTISAEDAVQTFKDMGLDVTAVDSGFAIHIRDQTVNKGKALEEVASILGISLSEMAAIGDAPNDVEMLQTVNISFTPANASDEAKNASTYTTKKPHGRGVKEAINQILEKQE